LGSFAKGRGDAVEIWDVRRGWIAKWAVGGSAAEGGVAGELVPPFPISWLPPRRNVRLMPF
jgi:hypothetical protein